MDVTVKPGWADKLKEGSTVIVHDGRAARPEGSRSLNYASATVDRVTATEVHVGGSRYRRGKGRSKYVEYQNEGMDIDRLSEVVCPRIYPDNAATRRWLDEVKAADEARAATVDLVLRVRVAVDAALSAGDTAKLKAALRALTRK